MSKRLGSFIRGESFGDLWLSLESLLYINVSELLAASFFFKFLVKQL